MAPAQVLPPHCPQRAAHSPELAAVVDAAAVVGAAVEEAAVVGAAVEGAAVVGAAVVAVVVLAGVGELPGSSTQPQGPCSLHGHFPAATYLQASLHLASVAPLLPAIMSRLARQTVPPQVCGVVTVVIVVVAVVVSTLVVVAVVVIGL